MGKSWLSWSQAMLNTVKFRVGGEKNSPLLSVWLGLLVSDANKDA
jgi:hypothetical protein